eukprot:Blabericola_migrator_1__343@NODE_1087_length_5486_cov_394_414652_g745_i0_p3_GENE_NODE_1087_length_5486_cov_394_414652_g745_i0NODE_1087_length_5486_cov_394_414652_g745_i0_p3_ORF_typecomplete_len147_score25_81NADH_B2/PF14813_6/0_24_NODE_1087_length_5486_cov_394_414652_g745_i032213661
MRIVTFLFGHRPSPIPHTSDFLSRDKSPSMGRKHHKSIDRTKRREWLGVGTIMSIALIELIVQIASVALPDLQLAQPAATRNVDKFRNSLRNLFIFGFAWSLFVWSFWKTAVTDPGGIPDTEDWTDSPQEDRILQRDKGGQLRYSE